MTVRGISQNLNIQQYRWENLKLTNSMHVITSVCKSVFGFMGVASLHNSDWVMFYSSNDENKRCLSKWAHGTASSALVTRLAQKFIYLRALVENIAVKIKVGEKFGYPFQECSSTVNTKVVMQGITTFWVPFVKRSQNNGKTKASNAYLLGLQLKHWTVLSYGMRSQVNAAASRNCFFLWLVQQGGAGGKERTG